MKRSAGSRGLMENWLKNCNKKTVTLSDRCETDSEQPNIETGSVIDIRSNAGHPNRLQSTASASSSTSSNDNLKITSNLSWSHNHPPAQPIISEFPVKNGRRFNPEHYKIFRWIEYSIEDDSVYCYACRHFCRNTVFAGQSYGKVAFVDYGVSKWRDIKSILQQHSVSQKHISSMTFWTNATAIQNKTSQNIANTLNENRACDVEDNRRHVRWLIKATCFLGRQGLAFRGKDESENSRNKGNFIELLEIFSDEDKRLKEKLSLRYGHYTSPEYQNDLIATVGALTRQSILDKMSSHGFFSILVDESKDISKKEQLSFVLRFVDKLALSDQSVDKVVRAEATGLLAEISRTEFTLTLCTMESILEKVHALSCELQNTELNIVAALKLVNCTKKMLENMRNDTSWNAIKDTATIMNSDQEMTIQRTRHSRQRKYNSRLTDYFVDSTIGKNDNPEIKIDVFFMVLDRYFITDQADSLKSPTRNRWKLTDRSRDSPQTY
ncbi:unnamed protein product [Phaedon cochleariae]|uniref:DUF4371 domain-containing protein n=1 Tax=Phaedon cochleariae TaxID=80249 RepID=A0A9N9X1V4_PHACE|nr:unnamed protein product [Phaedon cochleariae]